MTARNAAGDAGGRDRGDRDRPDAARRRSARSPTSCWRRAPRRRSSPAAAAFAGDALRFAVAGGGAAIDPATGALTLPTDARRAGETVTVTATNSGGAATVGFAVTVLAAPAASGAPDAAVFAVGSAATVDAGAVFTGDALVFALDAGPEGVTIDPATGLVTIPTGAALEGAVTVRATNAVGSATATFAVDGGCDARRRADPRGRGRAGTALGRVWNIAGGAFAGGDGPVVTERRFLRDGAAIAAFGAATAYTIVAADQGKTITAQVRRTDSSVPPQVLTVDATGAAVIPAAIPPMTATTAPTLAAAVAPGTALGSVWNIAGGAFAGGVAPIVTERRFLRDGAQIAAFGAATAYTIVAADQGKTITAQVRRTDSSVPPQVLTVDVAGSR